MLLMTSLRDRLHLLEKDCFSILFYSTGYPTKQQYQDEVKVFSLYDFICEIQ